MGSGSTTVGTVKYDAIIDLPMLRKSVSEADKIIQKSYSDQTKSAQKSSGDITKTSSKDAQARVDTITKEAQDTAKAISSYAPQVQRQFLTVERANNAVAAATSKAQQAIQMYGQDSSRAQVASSKLSIAVQNQAVQQEKLNNMLDGSSTKTNSFSNSMKTAGAIAGATAAVVSSLLNRAIDTVSSSIGAAVSRVDTLKNAPKIMQNLGYSASDSAKATKKLSEGIDGLPTSLNEATTALLAIASASGKSIDYASDLTLAFNNMALAGGKGSADAQRALTQFTQALGRGSFQANDFNTLMEVMPAQLTQVSKTLLGSSANAVTLKEALSNGSITVDQFSDAVIDLNKKGGKNFASFADQAKDATSGIGTSFSIMRIAIVKGVESIIGSIGAENISSTIKGVGTTFNTVLKSISSSITFVKNNSNVFAPLAIGIATAGISLLAFTGYMKAAAVVSAAYATASGILTLAMSLQAQGLGVARSAWLALTIAMNTNPVILAVTAIGLLTAAVALLAFNTGGASEQERKLTEQKQRSIDITNALKAAEDTLKDARYQQEGAALRAEQAQKALNTAIQTYGKDSLEARQAAHDLSGAQDELRLSNEKVKGATEENTRALASQKQELIDLNGRLETMNGKTFTYYIQGVEHTVQDYGKHGKFVTPTFATGGYTGTGSKYQEAGIVHAGEYVLPRETVDQNTGLPDWNKILSGSGIGGQSVNVTVNVPNGVFVANKSDKRQFANEIGKLINETVKAKTGSTAIAGI